MGRVGENKVWLMGNLKETPELRYTKNSGASVTNLLLAVPEPNGETSWHDVVVWGREAENCVKHCQKGKRVRIEGRLENEKIEVEGKRITRPKVHAKHVEFMFDIESDALEIPQEAE